MDAPDIVNFSIDDGIIQIEVFDIEITNFICEDVIEYTLWKVEDSV
jgi:hypothetical protein